MRDDPRRVKNKGGGVLKYLRAMRRDTQAGIGERTRPRGVDESTLASVPGEVVGGVSLLLSGELNQFIAIFSTC